MTSTASTGAGAGGGTLTLETLKEAIRTIEAIGPDPLVEYMKDRGFDPKRGCIMILPESERERDWGPFGPPGYVQFSPLAVDPMLVDLTRSIGRMLCNPK